MNITSILKEGCTRLNIDISEIQLDQFQKYYDYLIEYNQNVNLTAITEAQEVVDKHFLDSIYPLCLNIIPPNAKCADVGTGAGFPGVPLAIMRPDLDFTLIDALNKRLVFINQLCELIGIDNCQTLHSRAEDAGRTVREKFDCVFTRAVARLGVLTELCLPLVKPGGMLICYKGPEVQNEMPGCDDPIKSLGGSIPKILQYEGSDNGHNLIIIRKIMRTPRPFPRKAGIPAKNPLF